MVDVDANFSALVYFSECDEWIHNTSVLSDWLCVYCNQVKIGFEQPSRFISGGRKGMSSAAHPGFHSPHYRDKSRVVRHQRGVVHKS